MSELKTRIINGVIKVEGGYTNNPNDSGGPTKFGITEKVARQYGYQGDMRDLPKQTAFNILAAKYWDPLQLSIVELISKPVAEEMADTGVNQGIDRAARFLQRSLNVLNKRGTLYPDLVVDGKIGQQSVRALGDFLSHRGPEGETVLLRMLNSLQGAFYVALAERREKDETFIYGWFKDRVKIS